MINKIARYTPIKCKKILHELSTLGSAYSSQLVSKVSYLVNQRIVGQMFMSEDLFEDIFSYRWVLLLSLHDHWDVGAFHSNKLLQN